MKELLAQVKKTPDGIAFFPYSIMDQEEAAEFLPNAIVKVKVYGAKRPRSYEQLKLYWACCQTVAENTDRPHLKTKEQVDFQVRFDLKYFDLRVVNGITVVQLKSISFKELDHLAACRYFDRAFELMAGWLGITVEQLVEECDKIPF